MEEIKLCACGCGLPAAKNRIYHFGHHPKHEIKYCINNDGNPTYTNSKYCKKCLNKMKEPHLCACGCGQMIIGKSTKFISGHNWKVVERTPESELKRKEAYKKTCLEKYGVDCFCKTEIMKQKSKQTCLEKYGVDNIRKCNIGTEKFKKTCLQKYGVDNVSKDKTIIRKAIKHLLDRAWICIENMHDKWIPLFTKENFYENGWHELLTHKKIFYKFKCSKCGHIHNICSHFPRCPRCSTIVARSQKEIELDKFIQSLNVERYVSDRTILKDDRELDIYIPSKKLAIEFDGLYWHSLSQQQDENYHLNKTIECEQKGIHLIHIFEDEWMNNKDIVKSRIKNLLGIYDKIIYARQCEIRSITNKSDYIDFLNKNHTQGYVGCKYPIGLYYNNELVSLMTFGSLRKSMGSNSVDNQYELLRFCNKCGYHIPGSASKLFKYFIKTYNPNKIISYADKRWSDGNLYYKLGFTLSHMSRPNYWYVDPTYTYREYRFKYRKSELPKLLESFNPLLSEQQNMLDNGFDIIYDCGNYVFEWNP